MKFVTRPHFISLFCFICLYSSRLLQAQCPVTAFVNPATVICGSTVSLTAVADGCRPLNNNFNDGTINAGGSQQWQSTNGAVVQNGTGTFACVGPPSEGAYSLWMGTTVAAPRQVTTNGYDMTACSATSATLCFDMKYGVQASSSPCEGIDLPAEGIYVQYSVGGGAWVTLKYFDPNGGSDPNLTSWRRYCLNVPAAALTTNTAFRWYQSESSGAGFDAWGLDDMVINLNVPGYTFDWAHDAQGPDSSPTTPEVVVTSNTTYTVTYTNNIETCSSSVSVTVISPTATATVNPNVVCIGSPVQLNAISSINAPPPTSCGVNATAACTPFSTIADEQVVGAGATTIAYNGGSNNVFGNYGDAYQTAQLLFRASELTAAGIVAGQINSLSFDIERIQTSGGGTTSNIVYPNISISMGCTGVSVLSTLITGLSQVYSGTNVNLTTGMYPFFFNQSYNWDGVSNIVVQVCWYFPNGVDAQAAPPNGTGNYYAFCRYNSPGYNCYRYSGTNFSPGSCATNDFVAYANSRPNVKFGFCKPNNAPLTYSWTSNPAGFSSTIRNPIANPGTTSTTYLLSVNQTGMPAACAATSSVQVTGFRPAITINPSPAYICAPANSVNLSSTATTNNSFLAPRSYNSTPSLNIPDATAELACTGLQPGAITTNIINVSAASPATIGTNPIQSVTINITCAKTSDYIIRLISPTGTAITLVSRRGTGANFPNSVFMPTGTAISGAASPYTAGPYTPENPFSTFGPTEVVNGNWTLEIRDYCRPNAGSSSGTLVSWSIKFNAPNDIANYVWSPSTNLSSTTTANTTSNTTTDRTYTLTVTDNSGCSNSAQVLVSVNCSLPIDLSTFDAVCTKRKVKITWGVASQTDNEAFFLERSSDGIHYTHLASFAGAGTVSSYREYEFEDSLALELMNSGLVTYYRLKQIDYNGNLTELGIRGVNICDSDIGDESCLYTYPNPVIDFKFYITTGSKPGHSFPIEIYNMLGQLVFRKEINQNDKNPVLVEIPESIQSGIYYITTSDREKHFCDQKIMVY